MVLPSACADAVHDKTDLWSEAVVGPLKTAMPRVHVGAVPYALEADQAKVSTSAGGGLKGTLDGLVGDVAALKQAGSGGGGGGPWLVDANGTKIGRMLQVDEVSIAGYQNVPTVLFIRYWAITSTGFIVKMLMDGNFAPSNQGFAFSDNNCTGTVYTAGNGNGAKVSGKTAYYSPMAKGHLVPAGSATGFAASADAVVKSGFNNQTGLCNNFSPASGAGYLALQPITNTELGLPGAINGPLTIVP